MKDAFSIGLHPGKPVAPRQFFVHDGYHPTHHAKGNPTLPYKVKKGDFVDKIARKYGSNREDMRRANPTKSWAKQEGYGYQDYALEENELLNIPKPATPDIQHGGENRGLWHFLTDWITGRKPPAAPLSTHEKEWFKLMPQGEIAPSNPKKPAPPKKPTPPRKEGTRYER